MSFGNIPNPFGHIPNPISNLPNPFKNIPNPFDSLPIGSLPFPNLDPKNLPKSVVDLVTALVGLSIAPVEAAIVASYFEYLEHQASGKLRKLPEIISSLLQPHYGTNLDDISFAGGIDTIHGQNITIENHIYFTASVDFNNMSDLHLLCHELEHCKQWPDAGGKAGFVAKYATQVTGSIISKKSLNVHDIVSLERDAENKANSMSSFLPVIQRINTDTIHPLTTFKTRVGYYLNCHDSSGKVSAIPSWNSDPKQSDEIFRVLSIDLKTNYLRHGGQVFLITRRGYLVNSHGSTGIVSAGSSFSPDPNGSDEIFTILRVDGQSSSISSGDLVYITTRSGYYWNSHASAGEVAAISSHSNDAKSSDEIFVVGII